MNIEILKKQKKELKLTFKDLENKSGVSSRTIKGIFNGENKYSNSTKSTMQAIMKALEIKEYNEAPPVDKQESNLLKMFNQLSELEKIKLLSYLEGIEP